MSTTISVKVSYDGDVYNFSLLSPSSSDTEERLTFTQLCDALVHQLDLDVSVEDLENQGESPLRIWHVDNERNISQIVDTETLSEVLKDSPSLLRIRLRPAENSPPSMNTVTMPSSNNTSAPTLQPNDRASTATLLRIYNHVRAHASSVVAGALDSVDATLGEKPDDAALLRQARHRLTYLFASFLHHLHTLPADYRISRKLLNQLITKFTTIATDISLSDHTLQVILDAIRATCSCRFAVSLIRTKYTQLVPEDDPPAHVPTPETITVNDTMEATPVSIPPHVNLPTRPLKHYLKQFSRLLQVAGPNVQAAKTTLDNYQNKLLTKGIVLPEFTVKLCRSFEKLVFHVARFHIAETDEGACAVEERAIVSFSSSVSRKLTRAGFPDRYVKKAAVLVTAMAKDDSVVETVVAWAKKKINFMIASATPVVSQASTEMRRTSRVTEASTGSESVQLRAPPKEDDNIRFRLRSRSPSRSSHTGSISRSNLDAGSLSEHVVDLRGEPCGSNISKSVDEGRSGTHEPGTYYNERRGRLGSQMSDDEPPFGVELDPDPYAETPLSNEPGEFELGTFQEQQREHSPRSSGDTSRSQWARVEMEKGNPYGDGRWSRSRHRHGPSRRERSPSPLPPHHGYGRQSTAFVQGGASDVQQGTNGSFRSGARPTVRHIQGGYGSIDGSGRHDHGSMLEDDGGSIATNETLHSDDTDNGTFEPARPSGLGRLLSSRL